MCTEQTALSIITINNYNAKVAQGIIKRIQKIKRVEKYGEKLDEIAEQV